MKQNKLAQAILRGTWLMDPRMIEGLLPRAISFLNQSKPGAWWDDDDDEKEKEPPAPQCILPNGIIQRGFAEAPYGSVALIAIEGSILKNDYCGEAGTETMGTWLKDAYANPNITGVILKINSGGGTVEGTGEFAQIISERNKPVVAFCDGLMASAAYWIGSACDQIIASYETVEFGSIGTMITFWDNKEAMAKYGYKQVYINADSSPDKNQDYFQAIEGNLTPIKVNVLNPTNDIFLENVRVNRAGKLQEFGDGEHKEPLTGKIYLAKRAIEIGLVDSIGDIDAAMEAVNNQSTNFSNPNTKNMLGNKFKKVSALENKPAADITEAEITAANAELEASGVTGVQLVSTDVIQKANENADSLSTAQETVTELNAQLTTLKGQVNTLQNELAAAKNTITELGKKPGADVTGAPGAADDSQGKEIEFYSEADEEMKAIRNSQKIK